MAPSIGPQGWLSGRTVPCMYRTTFADGSIELLTPATRQDRRQKRRRAQASRLLPETLCNQPPSRPKTIRRTCRFPEARRQKWLPWGIAFTTGRSAEPPVPGVTVLAAQGRLLDPI